MKYEHMLWCHEGTHDKVWGIICLDYITEVYDPNKGGIARYDSTTDEFYTGQGKFVTVWGRRGKKLQTKLWEGSRWDAKEMARKKQEKGYKPVRNRLNQVYPEFQADLEKTAFWATLKN